jgi:hypothetical protein
MVGAGTMTTAIMRTTYLLLIIILNINIRRCQSAVVQPVALLFMHKLLLRQQIRSCHIAVLHRQAYAVIQRCNSKGNSLFYLKLILALLLLCSSVVLHHAVVGVMVNLNCSTK